MTAGDRPDQVQVPHTAVRRVAHRPTRSDAGLFDARLVLIRDCSLWVPAEYDTHDWLRLLYTTPVSAVVDHDLIATRAARSAERVASETRG